MERISAKKEHEGFPTAAANRQSDQSLVQQVAEEQEGALAEVYRRHGGTIPKNSTGREVLFGLSYWPVLTAAALISSGRSHRAV